MNMQALMQQAQRMQKDMMKKKGEIDNKEFVGKSEWVEVVFTGAKVLKSVKITKNDSIEADDMEVLEDMIKIAVNSALKEIDSEMEKAMGPYGNALNGFF